MPVPLVAVVLLVPVVPLVPLLPPPAPPPPGFDEQPRVRTATADAMMKRRPIERG
jgi:hypothetical protein